MESSWLGLDDFFSSSSRLSSRRSRTRVSLDSTERTDYGIDGIKIDFGPRDIDFDTSALRSSILREFDSFPRKSRSSLRRRSPFDSQAKAKERQEEVVTENSKANSEYENIRELRLKLQNCQEENLKLQAVITDLTQVNKRWQKYNNDRQIYVQKLLNTIQDQQEQLNHIGERSVGQTSTTSPHNENDDELSRLRNVEQKLKERVSILEFQVKAHRDDWEAELNEKKQALKDKEILEQKIAKLITPSSELGHGRLELYCQNCGQVTEFSSSPPSRSRMYRTAVHLPCSSSQRSSMASVSTAEDELVFDSRESKPFERQLEEVGRGLKAEDTSYSRSSTVPLASGFVTQLAPSTSATATHSSTSSIDDHSIASNSVTVKSFMQIPIAKSSSVPEGSTSFKYPELPRSSLDCFKPIHNPPLTVVNSAEQYDGVETFSAENVICLRCGEVFPPSMHLKFLNHFPKCQTNRTHRISSEGDSKE